MRHGQRLASRPQRNVRWADVTDDAADQLTAISQQRSSSRIFEPKETEAVAVAAASADRDRSG